MDYARFNYVAQPEDGLSGEQLQGDRALMTSGQLNGATDVFMNSKLPKMKKEN
jgi:hypothetical protein